MKNNISTLLLFAVLGLLYTSCGTTTAEKMPKKKSLKVEKAKAPHLKALIIDGENNHGIWPKTTVMMKSYLEETGMFTVDINRKAFTWQGPHHNVEVTDDYKIEALLTEYPIGSKVTEAVSEPVTDDSFMPNFSEYDVVVSNLGWKTTPWPEATKKAFLDYMANGGGLVIIHAANNSFGDWDEYNKIIGLGGWDNRSTTEGAYVYYDKSGHHHRDETEGPVGSHGAQAEFVITSRAPEHPIMKGIPTEWMHTKDELYERLRGPAENITVLATAFSDTEGNSPPWNKKVKGTDRHEPMLFTVDYGKGRVFHNALGHMDYSMECVGFITTLQRGAEWAATGKVTQSIPSDFPSADRVSARSWKGK